MASRNFFSWVVLLTWIFICLITFYFNLSALGWRGVFFRWWRSNGVLLDLNSGPSFLDQDYWRNCWEHVHIILTSQNHSLLSISSLHLEKNSGHDHSRRSDNRRSWHLHPDNLEGEWRTIIKCEPWLIFHGDNWDHHHRLEHQIIRPIFFIWAIVSNECTIRTLAWILKMGLSWVNVVLLAWSDCRDWRFNSIVKVKNRYIYPRAIVEINSETGLLRSYASSVFSRIGPSCRWAALLWSFFFSSISWLNCLFTWWCATHFCMFDVLNL